MKKIYPLLIFLIILVSCVGPKYIEPSTELNNYKKYNNDTLVINTDSVLNLRWWELFNDNELNGFIAEAIVKNKNILMAANRVEQARAILGYTRADQYPSFGYSAGAARGNFAGMQVPLSNNFYANAFLNWELDFWGKFSAASESAKADLAASEYGLRSIQISVISVVASTYFLMLDLNNRLEIAKKTFASRDSGLAIIEKRFKYGTIPEIDLNQAQIQRAIAASAIPFYERQLGMITNSMNVLLGRHINNIPLKNKLNDIKLNMEIPYGLPSALLLRRPDILEAKELYHKTFKQINVAVAQRFPSINITGLLGGASSDLSSFTAEGLAWNLGSSLMGPIFNFGKNLSRVDIYKAKAQEALNYYDYTILTAFEEVENSLLSIETLKREMKAREAQTIAAINAETLSVLRYNKGVTSYLEVLENQRSSFNAQLGSSEVKQELLSAYITLYKVLGGGWLSQEEETESKNKDKKQ